MENCIFCEIVKKEIPNHTVYEDDDVLAFLDIYPKTKGHTLVIPKIHAENIFDIEAATLKKIISVAQTIAKAQTSALGATGVNLLNSNGAVAQQEVPHYHMHVIPRYNDGQKIQFVENFVDEAFSDTASLIQGKI